jgi:hypothetical protein
MGKQQTTYAAQHPGRNEDLNLTATEVCNLALRQAVLDSDEKTKCNSILCNSF